LSGFEMTTPITSVDRFPEGTASFFSVFDFPPLEARLTGVASLVVTGVSTTISLAGLSWRNPLNAA
jgi:hypothetical protein